MIISEPFFFFFFAQALFEQSDNGSSVIFTTFPHFQYSSSADGGPVVYYGMEGAEAGWIWCGLVSLRRVFILFFYSSRPLIALA